MSLKRRNNQQIPMPISETETAEARLKTAVVRQTILMIGALMLVVALIFTMAVAWFTNVSQTGGLQFQTEAWGFDAANIRISEEDAVYRMSPGSYGFVPLSIDNSSGSTAIEAEVNVSKTGKTEQTEEAEPALKMEEALQQRIYFYVDASQTYTFVTGETTSSETVSRVYLGAEKPNSFLYSIPAGETLTLSETYYSDAPLKWEWVYDMEGYYFRGTVSESDGSVMVEEYLRPIQYDLNDAVFDLERTEEGFSDTYGQLMQIGEVSIADFLKTYMDSDGYEGTLSVSEDGSIPTDAYVQIRDADQQGESRTYYKVDVDETGTGIWAYLCNYSDIQAASAYDSQLNEQETIDATVTVKVTVRNVDQGEQEISSADQLMTVLAESSDQVIRLNQDLNVASAIVIPEKVSAVINLNGYTVSYGGTETNTSLFQIPSGSELTLINGSLHGNGESGTDPSSTQNVAVLCAGGKATVSGISVSGFDTAVFMDDRSAGTDSVVKISNCNFDTHSTAVLLYGNGSATDVQSRVIIQNSQIRSDYIGISGQGTNQEGDQRWGTELILADSTIDGYWAGLYQPQQQSSTTITGGTITGYTGIAVKGGTVTVYKSEINGTGAYQEAKASGNGWTDTGDGIYVEAAYGWSATVVLRGTENKVTSTNGYALDLFGVSGKGPGKLLVEGGTYDGKPTAVCWNEIGSLNIRDGSILNGTVQNSSEGISSE